MRTILRTVLVCLIVPVAALSQDSPKASTPASQENPLSTWNKMTCGRVKAILLRSAEKMPEENYNFKPTDTVRSYGQIIGHVADAQYLFCSVALGEKNPDLKIEQTKNLQGRSHRRAQYRVRLLRQGLRRHDRCFCDANDKALRE
jgi:hypothetical protein